MDGQELGTTLALASKQTVDRHQSGHRSGCGYRWSREWRKAVL